MWERLWQCLFPDQCLGCARYGALLCAACCAACPPYHGEMPVCGADAMTILYTYTGTMRQAILRLKYARQRRMAILLGAMLAAALPPTLLHAVIVPIPGAPQRVVARGYDQAVLLAQRVGLCAQRPVCTALVRVRDTTAQARLNRTQRQQNVAQAFVWQGGRPPAQIVLVDDVCTTGATLHEAIAAIRRAGPCHIHVVVLARGLQKSPTHR